jgi:cholesterol oxidase
MTTQSKTPIGFQFTEEMKGYLAVGEATFEDGFKEGKAASSHFMFHLTIKTDDVDLFLSSPEHQAQAIGYVEGAVVGGRRPVLKGVFNLFVDTADANRKAMRYRLFIEDAQGRPMTMSGFKSVQDNAGPDIWSDTTTLYTNLYHGHIEADQEASAELYAAGILHILLGDFLHQLTTMQADAPTLAERVGAMERFGEFFLGVLWKTYGPHFLPRIGPFTREIPLFTTQGVQGADISTHPYITADRLGESLLRFTRGPCQDVVVLIPGLTASSDMFILPETYNLAQYLLDHGYSDVWAMDGRISNRYPYNLSRNDYNVDDLALYDVPAALATVRKAVGAEARIHVISHCFGALAFAMSLWGKAVTGIRSAIFNGVALTTKVPCYARFKLAVGPFLSDYVLGAEYLNPRWLREPGFMPGKILAWFVSAFHRECQSPECHMTSFMYGLGNPVLFSHANLHDITHQRTGDLFGGCSVNYYRHVLKMVKADYTAVKYLPNDPRYASLPDNYFQYVKEVTTPALLVAGQENMLWRDSNPVCYQRLEQIVPGRHQLHLFPRYGHADVIIGKNAHADIFPRFVEFLDSHKN